MEKLPTVEDVAALANVSTATVSRCLNMPDKVSKITRERVEKAVEELGYSPNFGARALAAKRTNTIGAIIPTMENAIFARALEAFQDVISQANANLLLASSSYNRQLEEQQIRSLVRGGADALLLIGTSRDQAIYDFLSKRNIPYMVAWSYRNDKAHSYSGFDNAKAMSKIAEYVLDHGHQNIAMIAGISDHNDRAADRIKGAVTTLQTVGLKLQELIQSPYTIKDGGDAFEQIMTGKNPLSAIICGNDVLAVGAIMRARQMAISVPEQVSITGFDNIEIASIISPKLTTMRVPHANMGTIAAQKLIAHLNENEELSSTEFMTEIIERETLAKL